MAILLVKSGKHTGKTIQLAQEVVYIGRDETAQIRIPSSEVSRLHCELKYADELLTIKDLGSKNGTLLNGIVIKEPTVVAPGSQIQIGPMVFEFLLKKPKKPDQSDSASEKDIANWLQEEANKNSELLSDTTIVSGAENPFYKGIQTLKPRAAASPLFERATPNPTDTAATASAITMATGSIVASQLTSETSTQANPAPEVDENDTYVQQASQIIKNYWTKKAGQ
jgi:predicted component of type VI protein secretion system